jgi:hypothetical protein
MEFGRSTQQEYLEWFVTRDKATGKIKKVTFTTESPDYWKELFRFDRASVLQLYKDLVSPSAVMGDLLRGGTYNPVNKWNTTHGIVHYIVTDLQNTLDAAIKLATGSASVTGTRHVRDNYEPTRRLQITSADPRVETDVNMLVRKGLSVSCREPIGLYMAGWDDTGWTLNDAPVSDFWHIVRGKPGAALRLEYEVPASLGTISDIKIGGRPIMYGGHLAEHVTVMIGGIAGTRAA